MHADATAASFAYIFGVDEAPHSGSFIIIIINLLTLSLYMCAPPRLLSSPPVLRVGSGKMACL
jgi:hypothetical protein